MDGYQPQFCNLLQVSAGAEESASVSPSGAVAEVKAASQKIAFLFAN